MSEDKAMTKEQAHGLVEDIVGARMKEVEERVNQSRADMMRDMAYALKHEEKSAGKPSREEMKKNFGDLIGCFGQSRGNLEEAAKTAKAHGNDYVAKALGTATTAAGGAIVIPEFASEIIELLRAEAVVAASGARIVPMDSGILHFGRVGTGATAAYRGESVAATASDPALQEVELRARILTVMTPASNQLLSRSPRAAEFIREELMASAKDKMDSTFIRSVGASHEPKGLLYQAASANKFNETNAGGASGTSTLAEIVGDLGKAIRLLMDGNVQMISPGWLFAPRTWQKLFTVLDSNGNFVFKSELEAGRVLGIPFKVTTNVPVNLTAAAGSGAGSDASEVYLADFWNILIGETEGLQLSVSTEGSYTTGGSLVSAFERGETLVKVDLEHDLAARHAGAEIVVIQSVTWSA